MKLVKILSWFLGISMFGFGVLKFVDPFKTWYTTQVYGSGLNDLAYVSGIAGEITTGMILITSMIFYKRIHVLLLRRSIGMASLMIIVMMLSSFYVHFHPNVPADVLPLNIKPPFVPAIFLLLAMVNLWIAIRTSNDDLSGNCLKEIPAGKAHR